jgi:molybdate transport system substrate-binding protein
MSQGAGMTGCKFFNAVAFSLAIASPTEAVALELRVLSGSGVQPVMSEIIPRFESVSGHRVIFDYGTVGGMAARIQDGESADVIIASGPQIAELEKRSKVVTGSRTDLAKTGIGIFVRKGTPKPDISSVDSFKRTMLASKSIGWNDPAAGAPVSIYMLGVFERLGISQEMKSKTVAFKQRSERFEAVARGDVEIGFNQLSEIMAATGVDLVGPLPTAIQHYTLFSAGIVANSANKDAAQALLRFISAPDAKAAMKAKGFEEP